jgi:hypothetical protein
LDGRTSAVDCERRGRNQFANEWSVKIWYPRCGSKYWMAFFDLIGGSIPMKICPKCGFERQPIHEGFIPDTDCPKCGVIYSKYEEFQAQKQPLEKPPELVQEEKREHDASEKYSPTKTIVSESINNIDLNALELMYNYIDRYYKSKNDVFKDSINFICSAYNNKYEDLEQIILKERNDVQSIRHIDKCDIDDDCDIDRQRLIMQGIRLYQDINTFTEMFVSKGINATSFYVFNVLVKVSSNNYKREQDQYYTTLYNIIKSRLSHIQSENDIIKTFITYFLDIGETNKDNVLLCRCVRELPRILRMLGYEYNDYTMSLWTIGENILKELELEEFEQSLDCDYTDLNYDQKISLGRDCISTETKTQVWRRDQGRCSRCSSRENLEYDHIIPVSKGGSNTARNIELLCQDCNRKKSNKIM